MATYVMIRVACSNESIANLNTKVTDDTKPSEGIQQLVNLLEAVNGGLIPAVVDVATRETTQSVTAQGSGIDATYTKT